MQAPDERPFRRDDTRVGWLAAAWIVAFVVPLILHLVLKAKHLVPEDNGNGCSSLSPADQREFDHTVVWLQIALVAWALAGAAVVILAWLRSLPRTPAAWVVLAGWLLGVAGELAIAWAGPATNGLGKALTAIVVLPAVLVVSALLMGVPLVWRRVRRGHRIPGRVLLGALAQIAVVILAGAALGGTGEVPLC